MTRQKWESIIKEKKQVPKRGKRIRTKHFSFFLFFFHGGSFSLIIDVIDFQQLVEEKKVVDGDSFLFFLNKKGGFAFFFFFFLIVWDLFEVIRASGRLWNHSVDRHTKINTRPRNRTTQDSHSTTQWRTVIQIQQRGHLTPLDTLYRWSRA